MAEEEQVTVTVEHDEGETTTVAVIEDELSLEEEGQHQLVTQFRQGETVRAFHAEFAKTLYAAYDADNDPFPQVR